MMHLKFLQSEQNLELAFETGYQPLLVLLSVLVAAIASYTAFLISERIENKNGMQRLPWLIGGAMSLGVGVWAMHFIGMLALKISIPINYDILLTLISMVPSLLMSILVLSTQTDHRLNSKVLMIRSVFMGAGIGTMHYTGMMAMQMDASMVYDPYIFALSILVAVGLAYIALSLKLWAENGGLQGHPHIVSQLGAATMMGIAISGMHYTGMAAVHFLPADGSMHGGDAMADASYWEPSVLGQVIGLGTIFFMLFLITLVYLNRRQELIGQLQVSEKKIRTVIDSVAEGILTFEANGTIRTTNPALERLFGYSAEEFLKLNLRDLIIGTETDPKNRFILYQIENQEYTSLGQSKEVSSIHKNGMSFPIDLNINSIEEGDNNIYIASIQDTTQRKLQEDSLRKSRDTMERLVVERTEKFKQARNEALKANNAKSEFLSRMSHEFRTPLNAILGFSELLQSDRSLILSESQRENINEINKAGEHLLNLVNDILELSKIEEGKMDIKLENVSLYKVLQESYQLVRPLAERKHIKIQIEDNSGGSQFRADFVRVKQVLLNLLSNGVKYTAPESVIKVVSEVRKNNTVRINVIDNGAGLSAQQIQKLFIPFERLEENINIEGTGIGLTICKYLIENMDGVMGVTSTPGEGSCFWFELPQAKLH